MHLVDLSHKSQLSDQNELCRVWKSLQYNAEYPLCVGKHLCAGCCVIFLPYNQFPCRCAPQLTAAPVAEIEWAIAGKHFMLTITVEKRSEG